MEPFLQVRPGGHVVADGDGRRGHRAAAGRGGRGDHRREAHEAYARHAGDEVNG